MPWHPDQISVNGLRNTKPVIVTSELTSGPIYENSLVIREKSAENQ
jgi:hypothetical protein